MDMETTLVVNPGSASKKYALYHEGVQVLAITFEKIGERYGKCVEINKIRQRSQDITPQEYGTSLTEVLRVARSEKCILETGDITRVGVRVVAPGTYFATHRIVDDTYIARLKKAESAAPLHISSVLDEFRIVREQLSHATIVGVSDSAFHSTIPDFARTYSIPCKDTEEFDVYRFGYHGLSVHSVIHAYALYAEKIPQRAIVCHVGSGVSVTALHEGKSIETSMGFSPASGLMMGTRAGTIDPGALLHLIEQKRLDLKLAHEYVNKEGGLRGILGTGDLRIALERRARGDARAAHAVSMYTYAIKKQIGASIAALGGLDALIFTATAVERNPIVRTLICEGLETFGIVLNEEANESLANRSGIISSHESRVRVDVILTDELRAIADEAQRI